MRDAPRDRDDVSMTGTDEDVAEQAAPRASCTSHAGALIVLFERGRPVSSDRWSLHDMDAVWFGRGDALGAARVEAETERRLEIKLGDRLVSAAHAQLRRANGEWVLEDVTSRNGSRVNGVTVTRAALRDGDVVELGRSFLLYREDAGEPPWRPGGGAPPLLTTCNRKLHADLSQLAVIARSSISILVTGETGSGKEVLTRAIHQASRRIGPLVAVNCGALSRSLLESELFGYRRGAFTGAGDDHLGLLRSADGGTLFLDEIGDLQLDGQAALLRVLEEREVLPVGAVKPVPVDLRFVAATHRDLRAMVRAREFRADLLARLNGFEVALPPLRERREDLGLLVATLLQRHDAGPDRVFESEAIRALLAWPWPENVRELDKVLAAAAVLAGQEPIALHHLALAPGRGGDPTSNDDPEKRRLESLLLQHRGRLSRVAAELGTSRSQVYRLCRRYGFDPHVFRARRSP